jgi:hypothetical protein
MAREQFMAHLKAKPAVMPKERVFRNDPKDLTYEEDYDKQYHDISGEPYHEEHTLPGGTNYREILLQHPQGKFPGVGAHFGGAPNILASIRAKDRISPEGKKILHIEEIQSDWHKQGSKKGYQPKGIDLNKEADKAKQQHTLLSMKLKEARDSSNAIDRNLAGNEPIYQNPEVRARQEAARIGHNNAIMDLMPQVMRAQTAHRVAQETARNAVPEAPFKKNWHELALKRMIHHAVVNGYDQIHITPGAMQAERWGASGEGAKGFHDLYDKQLPQFLNKFGKQYGSQVQQATIPGHPDNTDAVALRMGYTPRQWHDWTPEERAIEVKKIDAANVTPLHRFDITPQMREDVLKNGMPLYAEGGEVDVRPTIKWTEPKQTENEAKDELTGASPWSQNTYGGAPRLLYGEMHHNKKLIGRAMLGNHGDMLEIDKIWVDKAHRRSGHASHMIEEAKLKTGIKDVWAPHTTDEGQKFMESHDKKNSIKKAKGGVVSRETVNHKAKFLEDSQVKHRMYHATHSDFDTFRNNRRGVHFVTPDPEFANDFLTNSGEDEHQEGANVMPVHVQAKNPFDYENKKHVNALAVKASIGEAGVDQIKKGDWNRIEDRTTLKAIKDLGHDSVYVNESGVKNLGVFQPNQIKSAIGNRGTYDINDPHMNHAEGGVVSRETIKPVAHGIIKERVTVSPSMDAMRYELMSAKHFTKKVK